MLDSNHDIHILSWADVTWKLLGKIHFQEQFFNCLGSFDLNELKHSYYSSAWFTQ